MWIWLLVLAANCKVLEITQKNLVNVLHSHPSIDVLFHDGSCQHSINYHHQFMEVQHDNDVGVVNCHHQHKLCGQYNVTVFPALLTVSKVSVQPRLLYSYLKEQGHKQIQQMDEYLTQRCVQLLNSQHYIVVVFQQLGLPVEDPVIRENIFYLQEGKLANTMQSFIGSSTGCWIFTMHNDTLSPYYCGESYQTSSSLQQQLQRYEQGKLSAHVLNFDRSAYEDNRVLGYRELVYKFTHEHKFTQNCYLIYFWSENCRACRYRGDVKVIEKATEQIKQKQGKQWSWYTFNIDDNLIPEEVKITTLPSVVKICPQSNPLLTFMEGLVSITNLVELMTKKHTKVDEEL